MKTKMTVLSVVRRGGCSLHMREIWQNISWRFITSWNRVTSALSVGTRQRNAITWSNTSIALIANPSFAAICVTTRHSIVTG